MSSQQTARQSPQSVIAWPSAGQTLPGPGTQEIRGYAWSTHVHLDRVEVSTDGGQTWQRTELYPQVAPGPFTRFRLGWEWDGSETVIISRAVDATGREQAAEPEPTEAVSFNDTRSCWVVHADGLVTGRYR